MSFFGSKKVPPPPPVIPPPVPRSGPEIDATTVISLLAVLALLGGAYGASIKVLPKTTSLKIRVLFIWHLFDALIHFVFEGSFLWNCFFVTYSLPTSFSAASRNHPQVTLFTPPDVYWLGRQDLLYGANYGTGPLSRLWQEYAKADKRWGGTDLTVVALEILTVFVAGPLACWICYLLSKDEKKGVLKKWFWMIVLATGEIYGGDWLYLAFFNGLWVVFPLWILYEAYRAMSSAMSQSEMVDLVNYLKKDD
ncbi:unnamed protein product [Alternaria alternata]